MESTFVPHPRTTTATICSASSLLLLRFTLSRNIHFYCCKRFLGRNSTATTSAPHKSCQHPLKGALLLANSTTDLRLFWSSSYRHCWRLPDNWCTLTMTLHHDIATVNSEFIFSYLTDQSESMFRIRPANQRKNPGNHASSSSSSDLHSWCTSHNLRLVTKSPVWKLSFQYFFLCIKSSLIQKNSLSQK